MESSGRRTRRTRRSAGRLRRRSNRRGVFHRRGWVTGKSHHPLGWHELAPDGRRIRCRGVRLGGGQGQSLRRRFFLLAGGDSSVSLAQWDDETAVSVMPWGRQGDSYRGSRRHPTPSYRRPSSRSWRGPEPGRRSTSTTFVAVSSVDWRGPLPRQGVVRFAGLRAISPWTFRMACTSPASGPVAQAK